MAAVEREGNDSVKNVMIGQNKISRGFNNVITQITNIQKKSP